MKRAGVGRVSAAFRTAGEPPAAARTDPGARASVRRRVLLELQWQGRGGRFRHFVLRRPGLLRALGTVGVVAALALAVVVALPAGSKRALAPSDVATVLRENAVLKARHDALRERAFDLAEQLYGRVEQRRRLARLADAPGHTWMGQCPRPPSRDVGDEAILAWLSEQGTRLEAIGNELPASRVEMDVKLASAPAPGHRNTVPVHGSAVLQVADMGPARRHEAAPSAR
jgi:hypothetical protein